MSLDLRGNDFPTAIVANLPYNVAVPVLLTMLARLPTVRRVLVMVQLEVAARIAAKPGEDAYGIPSVKAAWYGVGPDGRHHRATGLLAGAAGRLRPGRHRPARSAGHDGDPRPRSSR